jgi:DNA-binding NtrC family response regulator
MSITKDMKKQYVVALVDDCADSLEIMGLILGQAGYTNVITASSATDALNKLGCLEQPVDAIITDYYLGDGTGFDVVTALMMADKAPPLRILVTGNPSASMVTSRIFDHTYLKPIRGAELCAVLDTHFDTVSRMAS